jgi:hypothetical protein
MIRSRFTRLLFAIAALVISGAAFNTPVAATSTASDYILCSCNYCRTHPNVVCRISPTGYSILCSDYSLQHSCTV